MRIRRYTLVLSMLPLGVLTSAQTQVYFKYDEAGNQRYRGPDDTARPAVQTAAAPQGPTQEEEFWTELSIGPVPVRDVLHVQWTDAVDSLIDNVSLYQHTTVAWDFQQKNMPNLNRQVQIDMTRYYMGVYILSFTLKDGRVYSRNITKQ